MSLGNRELFVVGIFGETMVAAGVYPGVHCLESDLIFQGSAVRDRPKDERMCRCVSEVHWVEEEAFCWVRDEAFDGCPEHEVLVRMGEVHERCIVMDDALSGLVKICALRGVVGLDRGREELLYE